MALVTENWKARARDPSASASREWMVSGVANENLALAAASSYGAARGATHPWDARLAVNSIGVQELSPGAAWMVRAGYVRIEDAAKEDEENPMDAPAKVSWSRVEITDPVERDVDGRVLQNSAQVLFDGMSQDLLMKVCTVTQNRSQYEPEAVDAFVNKVNTDQFTIPNANGGRTVVAPLMALCKDIRPATEYTSKDLYVPVTTELLIAVPVSEFEKSGRVSPHDWRRLDASEQGRYLANGKKHFARFVTTNGEPVPGAIRLNGSGGPFDTKAQYKVGQNTRATPHEEGLDIQSRPMDIEATPYGVFFWFKRRQRAVFGGIGL